MPRKNQFQKEHPKRRGVVMQKNPGFFTGVNGRPQIRRRESIDNEYARLVPKEVRRFDPLKNSPAIGMLSEKHNEANRPLDFEREHGQGNNTFKESGTVEDLTERFEKSELEMTNELTSFPVAPAEYYQHLDNKKHADAVDWATEAVTGNDYYAYSGNSGTGGQQYGAITAAPEFDGGWGDDTQKEETVSLPDDDGLGSWTTISARPKRTGNEKKTNGASDGRGCFNCGQQGHMKGECPEPLRSNGCFNCGVEGHMKSECPEPPKPRERACRNCGETSHIARDCPEPDSGLNADAGGGGSDRECYNCHEIGHLLRDCPTKASGGGGGGGGNRACFKCREEGHISRECPQGGGGGGGRACYKCGEEGHISRECPQGGGGGGGGGRSGGGGACYKCGELGHVSRNCGGGGNASGRFEACTNASLGWDEPAVDSGFGEPAAVADSWSENQTLGGGAGESSGWVAASGDDIKW